MLSEITLLCSQGPVFSLGILYMNVRLRPNSYKIHTGQRVYFMLLLLFSIMRIELTKITATKR